MTMSKLPSITFQQAEKLFGLFHLSAAKLSDTEFTFNPRIPKHPFKDSNGAIIEDDFTARISLAPSIRHALKALPVAYPATFVYAGGMINTKRDNIPTIKLSSQFPECPPDFGVDFQFSDYVDWILKKNPKLSPRDKKEIIDAQAPSDLPKEFGDKFYLCVPDAIDTQEEVSLQDVTLGFLGTIEDQKVELSPWGVRMIRRASGKV